ncbi:tetratricopeptide repeat protein [Actinacidiphila acididurans]|uniref:tetratricopeptide repeat protein n=1 Tax=Actinacidiphila acididurans TaxID=2784346 RepID=UPI0027DD29BA|nr:tetratricopeptide repeat protein [Actinacidiphila acididurans]
MAESERYDNIISGDARLHGPTVQAGAIHGGVHFHTSGAAGLLQPPRQLLPVPSTFVNRVQDLAALDALLAQASESRSAQPLIVVTGPAGVGKTSLASKWLRTFQDHFPGGHLYADLRGHAANGPALPSETLGRFLRDLGAPTVPSDPQEQAALWRTLTAGRKVTVMLDNAFSAAQVRPLIPGDPSSLVVITSRRLLTGLVMDGAGFHRVEPFDADDSLTLLTRVIGRDRVAGQRAAAADIVDLCSGLPLAVALASARLAARPAQPLETLARALADDSSRLTALNVEGEITISHTLNASYIVLSEQARFLYRKLGLLPLRLFDPHIAAAVCGRDLPWAQQHLDELREASLLEDTGPVTARFHDLVRVHARARAESDDPPSVRQDTLRAMCDWHLRTATAAQQRITPIQYTLPRTYASSSAVPLPFDDDAGALAWLDERREELMVVLQCAADNAWHDTAWQLVDAMWPLFLRMRHYDLWIRAHEIGLRGAEQAGNAVAQRQMLNSGAIGLVAAGQPDKAAQWYARSLQAARDAADARDEGQALHGLGTCHQQVGDWPQARSHLLGAIDVWQRCGYPRGVALSRIVLGEIALALHNPEQAEAHFTQAYQDLLRLEDAHDATRALVFLGSAQAQAGRYREGRTAMESALAAFTASGAMHWQARALEMLAAGAEHHGDYSDASRYRARAVDLYAITSPRDARRLTPTGDSPDTGQPRL